MRLCVCSLVMLVCNSGGGILTKLSEVSENDVSEREARMWFGVAKFLQKRTMTFLNVKLGCVSVWQNSHRIEQSEVKE